MISIGQKFHKWTVLKQVTSSRKGKHFECICECGTIKIIIGYQLKTEKTKQCQSCQKKSVIKIGDKFEAWEVIEEMKEKTSWGARKYKCRCKCFKIKIISVGDLRRGKSTQCVSCNISKKNTSHGLSKTPTYKTWAGIIGRCLNSNKTDYPLYGGRGIKVFPKWKIFENFFNDMGEKPKNMEIDRIDPDGNYEPENCRWVTRQENVRNRRMSAQNRDLYILVCIEKLCKNCQPK